MYRPEAGGCVCRGGGVSACVRVCVIVCVRVYVCVCVCVCLSLSLSVCVCVFEVKSIHHNHPSQGSSSNQKRLINLKTACRKKHFISVVPPSEHFPVFISLVPSAEPFIMWFHQQNSPLLWLHNIVYFSL